MLTVIAEFSEFYLGVLLIALVGEVAAVGSRNGSLPRIERGSLYQYLRTNKVGKRERHKKRLLLLNQPRRQEAYPVECPSKTNPRIHIPSTPIFYLIINDVLNPCVSISTRQAWKLISGHNLD
jgi:hypothetical protein